ncbi:MAG TPA: hypothetical protein PLX85_00040 [Dehalococcoidia bacterium]|nr:hypothetical protein [Dehalococcoidia bacterium]
MKEFRADGIYSTDDFIVVQVERDGKVCVEINEPWAGDTQTGFGRHCSIDLSAEDALELRDFLNDRLPSTAPEVPK